MEFVAWFVVAGLVLTLTAFASSVVERLPLSVAQVYLVVGVVLGPLVLGMLDVDLFADAAVVERVAEVSLILSLFVAGLKLRNPFSGRRWPVPVRLAVVSMVATIGLVAAVGVWALGLPLGAAVLLGAVLAPTDPVLASDVQLEHPDDRDRLRFGLTGEAGLNDGSAFPFVMLGLGLLGLHELGPRGLTWLGVDVVWAVAGGLGIGAILGAAVGRLVTYLRRTYQAAVGTDDYLALGLIALIYGVALVAHTYAFLAVFAAGVALRYEESRLTGETAHDELSRRMRGGTAAEAAVDEEMASAFLAETVFTFAHQVDRLATVAVLVLVGALAHLADWSLGAVAFVAALFLVVRPLSVWLGLAGTGTSGVQRGLTAWFGVRGVGSLYYLCYAIEHDLPEGVAGRLIGLVLATVVLSTLLHGTSVTPLMAWYEKRARREERVAEARE